MTLTECKNELRRGNHNIPGASRDLFETAVAQIIEEDHPGTIVKTLVEHKQPASRTEYPDFMYERVLRAVNGTPDRSKPKTTMPPPAWVLSESAKVPDSVCERVLKAINS